MIVNYIAFSSTLTAPELKKILIANVKDTLDRGMRVTERKLEGDPDKAEVLAAIRSITADLEDGKRSPFKWTDVVDWSFNVQDNDPTIGGSVGKATYYAAAGNVIIPETALGKTTTVIDRPDLHLYLAIEVIA